MSLKNLLWVSLILVMAACGNRGESDQDAVLVKEVIEVQNYTYLLVEKGKEEFWMAAPAMIANPGERYTYQGGMKMTDFYSKELDKTFDMILFVEGLFPLGGQGLSSMDQEVTPGSMTGEEKVDVVISHAEGVTPIAELFRNPGEFTGKLVRVSGEVAKFNPAIMERNWVHLQDGSEYNGKFDLTVTTAENLKVGDKVTMEGILVVDQDFGYGYTYEILLEKAKAVR